MKTTRYIFFVIFTLIICGNVFAVSPYAQTIKQNISNKSFLVPTSFPTTVADTSFITRMENKRDGYMPYFNRSAFAGLSIEEQNELESMFYRAEVNRINMLNNAPRNEYCATFAVDDPENCPQTPVSETPNTPPPASIYDGLIPPESTTTSHATNLYMTMALTPYNVTRYNLKVYNGGCTPPERSNWWRNIIQTTGRYEQTDSPFEKFMITAFRKEGDCGTLPNDRGGYTCFGCASNGLCAGIDMSKVTRGMVEDLAYTKMYRAYNVNKLPDAFRGYAMWGIWGSGPKVGINLFQSALGIPKTGKIDDATITAAKNYRGDFGAAYTRAQEQLYRNLVATNASRRGFLQGWLNTLPLLQTSGCHVVPTNPIYR